MIGAVFGSQVFRFLLMGGFAAAVTWLVRFPLSMFMPFAMAVAVAQAIGLSIGFTLYRAYVFPGSDRPLLKQIGIFLSVNLSGAVMVLGIAVGLVDFVFPAIGYTFMPEGTGHAIGIAVGAVANFLGHKFVTFRHTGREVSV